MIKLKKTELANYLFFGGMTTLLNIITFKIVMIFIKNYVISNVIAFICSVVFAYITNKKYVFKTINPDTKLNIEMFFKFLASRLFTFGIDMLSMYIFIEIILMDELLSKIMTNIIVVILNYIISKIFIFNTKKQYL